MDKATIDRTIRIAGIIQQAVRNYVRDDQRATYPLPGDVWVTIDKGRTTRQFPPETAFTTADKSLSILRNAAGRVRVTAHAFPRESKLWNGPDVLRNTELASMFASLFHDLMWAHRAELADALGMSVRQVMKIANDVFTLAWRTIDPSLIGRVKCYFAFQAVNAATPWFERRTKGTATGLVLLALSLGLMSGCAGCASLPDDEVVDFGGVDVVQGVMDEYGDGL